ncbi:MAG TPA: methyltransferase domain-containing protein, partial [Blastocatellia bacterium]|nr:methyltransferase domain-containing protein [Blastocatellia bacterium]
QCIDISRISEGDRPFISNQIRKPFDFESISQGGRGEMYRRAQQDPLVRATGIKNLFRLVSPDRDLEKLSPQFTILDVLGGDGVLARAMQQVMPSASMPSIITSDLSDDMVAAAQEYGLFAIRQPAQSLLLKDNSIDGVIIAYGTHHIPKDQQLQVCKEAFRVLKPGGHIAFHDFEVGSPISHWFSEVVDPYSLTGHSFPHFTREEMKGLLFDAGFDDAAVVYMYDPFILSVDTEAEAQSRLAEYLLNMYGLAKLVDQHGEEEALRFVYSLALKHLRYDYERMGMDESFGAPEILISEKDGHMRIEAPRVALVGAATKPCN